MKFPVPTEGTAWASGGISGKVKVFNRSRRRRSPMRKKPWEDQNWIPYIGAGNTNPALENAVASLTADTVGATKRLVYFSPAIFNQETLLFNDSGQVASDESWKIRKVQGGIDFDGLYYLTENDIPGVYQLDATAQQQGLVQRVFWSWQVERLGTSGAAYATDDIGVGLGSYPLGGVKAYQSKHLLNWGVVNWTRTSMNSSGTFTGNDQRHNEGWRLPGPRIPKGGLNVGKDTMLSCIVRCYPGLMYGADISYLTQNSSGLPIKLQFKPVMRFLVSG